MKKCLSWLNLSVLVTLLVFTASPAEAGWQEEWDKVLAAARNEGTVFVSGPPGAYQRQVITEEWAKAFPDIALRYTGARGSTIVSKVARERRVDIFNWDIVLASTNPTVFVYKAINALAPLRDSLIIPDSFDDKKWIHGFAAGFLDEAKKLFYAPIGTAGATLGYTNRDCVPATKFNSAEDFMKPEFKGKIVWYDPTRPGSSSRSTWVLSLAQGQEWLKNVFTKQAITFSRDYRQMTDWVVSCTKPISIGMSNNTLQVMQKEGIGTNVKVIGGPAFFKDINPGGGSGNASIGWYNKAPHPDAAKVFVNWYLSREFQQRYADIVEANSRRLDTKPRDPDPTRLLKPDVKYFNQSTESSTLGVKALQAKIKKWGVLRRR